MHQIAILGDGGWGTALGLVLVKKGHHVRMWGYDPDYIARVNAERQNTLYLPGVPLPDTLEWTADQSEAVRDASIVVLAIPSKYYRSVLKDFRHLIPSHAVLVSVSKGLDPETHTRLTVVAGEELGHLPVAALSGPSHAEEVARGVPTAVVVACADHGRAKLLQDVFMNPQFRVYTSDDVVGVELGGALKNIMALAVGASDGIGFGDNTRAALITRGLAEMSRLGCALGARAETFSGLSGVGDLIVTCTSRWSRNRSVGERLGHGERMDQIMASMKQVAEGVTTCGIARAVAREQHIRAPIIEEVHAIIHEGKSAQDAVQALMTRDARPERD